MVRCVFTVADCLLCSRLLEPALRCCKAAMRSFKFTGGTGAFVAALSCDPYGCSSHTTLLWRVLTLEMNESEEDGNRGRPATAVLWVSCWLQAENNGGDG